MKIRILLSRLLSFIPDEKYTCIRYWLTHKKLPNLDNPTTFNEKLLAKKLRLKKSKEYTLREMIVDRIKVREYISSQSTLVDLIPILWTGRVLTYDVWEKMPEKFVIKANHGSQMVCIVNKNNDEFSRVKRLSESWLKMDYFLLGREWVYKNTDRVLLIEEFISFDGNVPPDFKFHCFNGKVELIQVDIDRFGDRSKNLYDRSFQPIDGCLEYKNGPTIDTPKNFDNAINISERLASNFDYIRVDLYLLDSNIYFGELTNFPGNCNLRFNPESLDHWLGSKWDTITNIGNAS